VIDLYASIHDDGKTIGSGIVGGQLIDNAKLHPDRRCAYAHSLLDKGKNFFRTTENIDDIDLHRN